MANSPEPKNPHSPDLRPSSKPGVRPPAFSNPTAAVAGQSGEQLPQIERVKSLEFAKPDSASKPSPSLGSDLVKRDLAPEVSNKFTRIPHAPMKATTTSSDSDPIGASPVAKQHAPELVESVPMLFCWALLSVAALLLTIQLWTYFF